MHRRREDPEQRLGRKRLLATALLGIGLSAALVISGCGANATTGKATSEKDKSPETAIAAASSSQGGLPQGSEPVKLDPADFTTRIDNPYWPMAPATNGSTAKRSRGSRSCGSR